MERKYAIQKIDNDNLRPGMPEEGYQISYDIGDYGWKHKKCFQTLEEAEKFVASL